MNATKHEAMVALVEEMNSSLMPPALRAKILAYFPPIEVAHILYCKAGLDFNATLASHLREGYVVARPSMFSMFRAVQLEEGPAWRFAVAVGTLPEIIGTLPFFLPYATFERRLDPRSRVLSIERVIKLAARMQK